GRSSFGPWVCRGTMAGHVVRLVGRNAFATSAVLRPLQSLAAECAMVIQPVFDASLVRAACGIFPVFVPEDVDGSLQARLERLAVHLPREVDGSRVGALVLTPEWPTSSI